MAHLTEQQLHFLQQLLREEESCILTIMQAVSPQARQSLALVGVSAPARGLLLSETVHLESQRDLVARQVEGLCAIEAAYKRIEQGDYGVCEHCGEPIDYGRLLRDPVAKRCTSCHADEISDDVPRRVFH